MNEHHPLCPDFGRRYKGMTVTTDDCRCPLIFSVYHDLRAKIVRLPAAAFALTDHDPSPLVWKSDVLDLLDSRIDKPKE